MTKRNRKPGRDIPVVDRKTGVAWHAEAPPTRERPPEERDDTPEKAGGVTGMTNVSGDSEAFSNKQSRGLTSQTDDTRKSRMEIATVEVFIEAFFAGRVKTLSDKVTNKIKRVKFADQEARDHLVRIAVGQDGSLERVRQLMMVAMPAQSDTGLKASVREFARDVVIVRLKDGLDVRPWFARAHDSGKRPLEALWRELERIFQQSASTTGEALPNNDRADDRQTPVESKKEAFAENRLVRNVFFTAALWSYAERLISLPQVLREFRTTAFAVDLPRPDLDLSCLSLLSSSVHRDQEGLGSLLTWFSESTIEIRNRADFLEARAEQFAAKIRQHEETLRTKEHEVNTLNLEINALREQIANAHEITRVQSVHMRDDLERQRGRTLRALDEEVPILVDCLKALDREPPKVAVAKNYLGSVLDRLNEELRLLKEE